MLPMIDMCCHLIYYFIISMNSQNIGDEEECTILAKKPQPIPLSTHYSFTFEGFLLHFKRYRYVYLLVFTAVLVFILITYAKLIFAIRSSIAELITLQRSTYSRDIANLQIQPFGVAPTKQIVTQEQVLLAEKWKNIRYEDSETFSDLANEELQYYQDKYNIIDYEEHPFCLIVHSLENHPIEGHLQNIKSILMQNYNHFHIVYIDRTSSQNPKSKQIEDLFIEYNQKNILKMSQKKIKKRSKLDYHIIIHTDEVLNEVENLYLIAQSNCKPEELIVFVDSSNYFIGREVLKVFNAVYEDKKYEFAYTNFLDANNQIGTLSYMGKKKFNETFLNGNFEAPLFAMPSQTLSLVLEEYLEKPPSQISQHLPMNIIVPILEYLKGNSLYIPEVNYAVNYVKQGKTQSSSSGHI